VEVSTFDLSLTSGGDLLLSEGCLRVLERAEIQGLVEVRPIDVMTVEGPVDRASVGKYFLAEAVRWGAEVDRAKSGLRTTEPTACTNCGYAGLIEGFDRVCVLEESWTGKDLFRVKGLPATILATERMRRLLIQNDLKMCCTPAEKDKMPMLR